MIKIAIGASEKVKNSVNKKSGFVSFDYDSKILEKIKSLSTRYYISDRRCWEVPYELLSFLCNNILNEYDIEITGTYEKDTSSSEIPDSFKFKTEPYFHQFDGLKYGLANSTFLLGDDQGLGKALSLDTKIYTPNGYKLMKDILVGDLVFNKKGDPVKVIGTYYHSNVKMYRITFSDGVSINCCEDHLWEINTIHGKSVVDTKWFLKKDQFGRVRADNLKVAGIYKYYIDKCQPVKFNERSVYLDPYVIGCLLGDGGLTGSSIGFTSNDKDIVNRVNKLLPVDYELSCSKSMADNSYNIVKVSRGSKENKVKSYLKNIGLMGRGSHEKFIPEDYLYNSVQNRKDLLAGLIDTDGYVSKDNLVQYTTVSKRLCEDVVLLVESLGGIASISDKVAKYNGKETSICYTITIRFDNPENLCYLSRKNKLLKRRKFKPRRNIIKIERVEDGPAKCITVDDEEHLYLAEHFVVTHNTKQTIDIAVARKKRGEIKRCLIICGVNGLKYNWESEIAVHSDEKSWILGTRYKRDGSTKIGSTNDKLADLKNPPDCFFLITNIETLRGLHTKKKYPFADEINRLCKEGEIGMIVFDEAHKCKNPTAAQTAALIKLNADYKMALSGTFLMNSPLDLYVPLKWTGKISSSFYEYKKHYCLMGGFNHSEVIGYKNLDELREIMSQSMLRRLKTEVLDLPEKVRTVEYVEMTSKQSKIYDEIKDMLRREIDKIRLSNNPMSKLIRLRQATAWTGILSSQVQESAKMSRLVELTEEIVSKGEKCIIFSNWESVTSVIKDKLSKYNPAYITGSVDEDDRNKERDRFQKDPKCSVIIGTIGALGTGFTLTAAQTVIFMDSPWNRALKDQAEDRAHRIGTRGTVTIITLVTKDTIDEVIENIVYKKGAMSDRLIDGKMPMQVATSIVEQSLR